MSDRSVVYITAKVSGELYFVINRGHEIVDSFRDFGAARRSLQTVKRGYYVMRGDGVMLAFMTSESGSRMPTRIPKDLKRRIALRVGVKKVSQSDQPDAKAKRASRRPRRAKGS